MARPIACTGVVSEDMPQTGEPYGAIHAVYKALWYREYALPAAQVTVKLDKRPVGA